MHISYIGAPETGVFFPVRGSIGWAKPGTARLTAGDGAPLVPVNWSCKAGNDAINSVSAPSETTARAILAITTTTTVVVVLCH